MSLIHRWFPKQPGVPVAEKILAALSAFLGITLLAVCTSFMPAAGHGIQLASMGATAVLLFATPHSTFVQPSAVMGGHLLSAAVGVAAAQWIPPPFAAPTAVAGAILLMHLFHCLHPPGGATALFAVIGGEPIRLLGYEYLISPVAVNAGLMVLVGWMINNLRGPRVSYPAPLHEQPARVTPSAEPSGLSPQDLHQALATAGTYIDITEDDLITLVRAAEANAKGRYLSRFRVSDLAYPPVARLRRHAPLARVWEALKRAQDGCVVIVDDLNKIEGIITRTDVINHLTQAQHSPLLDPFRARFRTRRALRSQDIAAADLMSRPVVTLQEDTSLGHAATLFAKGDFHHLPVVDPENHLLGVITHAHLWRVLLASDAKIRS